VKLYDYYRSSASYRVRIVLELKGIDVERVPVDLRVGEQGGADYRSLNPQGLVPALVTSDGVLGQSLAIIEYLDERWPEPPLLPKRSFDRARMRSLAQAIACDVHPLNNLRVLNYLRGPLGQDETSVQAWMGTWIQRGFEAVEREAPETGFFGGDAPMLADVVLVPQMYNARRFDVDLTAFPRLVALDARLRALPAFERAAPERVAPAL
jgi:maleylacetoacetate isomerase